MTFSCKNFRGIAVKDINKILSCIEKELEVGGRVAVHCWMGRGRTGTILAAFLMKQQGLSASEGVKLIRKMRPGSVEGKEQEECLESFEKYFIV